MLPHELAKLITALSGAADIVDAIDNPSKQVERGWDLTCWSYDFVPWGVRFLYRKCDGPVSVAVVAAALPETNRERLAKSYGSICPTILLMLG